MLWSRGLFAYTELRIDLSVVRYPPVLRLARRFATKLPTFQFGRLYSMQDKSTEFRNVTYFVGRNFNSPRMNPKVLIHFDGVAQ
jgi:hypothetical protein